MPSDKDFDIASLGPNEYDSPLLKFRHADGHCFTFTNDYERILIDHRVAPLRVAFDGGDELPAFERAGARRKIFFDPEHTTIGVVTCGGLCPGSNNVIRDIVMTARHRYGVKRVLGFRYGYRGLVDKESHVELTPDGVKEIHELGGTILGTSRGPQDTRSSVDTLEELGIDILFTIGGDGTMRGALPLSEEIKRRNLQIAVVGIPKTIDNDFKFMDQSFGFVTAYSKAIEAIDSAHREAQAAPCGIGLVKLMGRHSGFLACAATLASNQVNFTLIPEVPFDLEGPNGFLEALKERLMRRDHALIVVAEGAGQDLVKGARKKRDASGNVALGDIGPFLAKRIGDYFETIGMEITLKYIDPSYIIRSVKASPPDSVLCTSLAINAVHAAMAGKTEMVIAVWHRTLVHVPMRQAISERHTVDPAGPLWLSVLGTTGQPSSFSQA
jgi:6-phosphofructokinase 1